MVCKSEGNKLVYSGVVQQFNPYTDETTFGEGIMCTACDTMHFCEGERITYQFYPTMIYGRRGL